MPKHTLKPGHDIGQCFGREGGEGGRDLFTFHAVLWAKKKGHILREKLV